MRDIFISNPNENKADIHIVSINFACDKIHRISVYVSGLGKKRGGGGGLGKQRGVGGGGFA